MRRCERLHGRFRIAAADPPEQDAAIAELVRVANIRVPDDYLAWAREGTDIEILVDGEWYVRIWGPSGCIEMNAAYNLQRFIPESLAVGDDEGGKALIYLSGAEGLGLYLLDFSAPDLSYATYVAPSLDAFLLDGVGLRRDP